MRQLYAWNGRVTYGYLFRTLLREFKGMNNIPPCPDFIPSFTYDKKRRFSFNAQQPPSLQNVIGYDIQPKKKLFQILFLPCKVKKKKKTMYSAK